MAILRNIQIAKQYNVTPATVGNWIDQARNNRIGLEITSVNGRYYIKDTQKNHLELDRLKREGAKFRAKQAGTVKIQVNPKLYEIFTQDQLISLFVNISYYNFIPVKLSYTGDGAKHYDNLYKYISENPKSKPNAEISLVNKYFPGIVGRIIEDSGWLGKANLIELGSDNATNALKNNIKYLAENEKLNKYISLGLSEDMAEMRRNNLKEIKNLAFEKYIFDIEENVFRNILFKESGGQKVLNLCMLLMSGITNVHNISALLATLVTSLSPNDFLLISTAIKDDEEETKLNISDYFYKKHTWLFDVLGISPYITLTFGNYDEKQKMHGSYFIMNRDVELDFTIDGEVYNVKLERDRKITFMISKRYSVQEYINLFQNAGLVIDQYNTDRNQEAAVFLLRTEQ